VFDKYDKDVMDRLKDCMDAIDTILFYYERGITARHRSTLKKTLERSRRAFDRKANRVVQENEREREALELENECKREDIGRSTEVLY
jgi:hypothetical protein